VFELRKLLTKDSRGTSSTKSVPRSNVVPLSSRAPRRAAPKYRKGGGKSRFILKLAECFGEMPLARLDQAAVDAAALDLYPRASPATRNRQVYSLVSAILKSADAR